MKLDLLGEFRVLTLRECTMDEDMGDTPEKIADYYRTKIITSPNHNPDVESLYGIVLSTRKKILGHHLVAQGTLDTILAHPREVYRPAIVANSAAIVLLHNHPSGDPTPSEADIRVTRDMIRAGQLLKIEMLDHIIMGTLSAERSRDYSSLRELGYFYT